MRRGICTEPTYKWILIISAVMVLVFCKGATQDAQAAIVLGLVTRGGVPCPNARVTLTDLALMTPVVTNTVLTNSMGCYTFSGLMIDGHYGLTVNAVDAVAQANIPIYVDEELEIRDVDLVYGISTPLYDDFSGSSRNQLYDSSHQDDKWMIFDSDNQPTPEPVNDTTETLATIVNGVLRVNPHTLKGGVRSTNPLPAVATYEFVFPQHYGGVATYSSQSFAIIRDTDSGHNNIIEVQDRRLTTSTAPQINIIVNGVSSFSKALTAYPVSVKIIRTYNYFDIYINGNLEYSAINSNIRNDAYIYLYGHEETYMTLGTMTIALPTINSPTYAYFDNIRVGVTEPFTLSTIADVKAAENGHVVTVSDLVVTASFADAFWVENTDRSAGVKVISTAKPIVGSKVFINGTVVKSNNEVAIQPLTLTTGGSYTVPTPVGITGKTAGELDKDGAAAQGMSVKVSGKVTEIVKDTTNTYVLGYYLDDGSGLSVGNHKGLYVIMNPIYSFPASEMTEGQFKTAAGPMTIYMVDGSIPHPAVISLTAVDTELPTFTAYNDVLWYTGQPETNITKYSLRTTATSGGPSGGYLMDYTTGHLVPERVAITHSLVVSDQNLGADPLAEADPLTNDVAKYFRSDDNSMITSLVGCLYPGGTNYTGWWCELTFSGLNPDALYEFIGTANRDETAASNISKYTILDAYSFLNSSSNGATIGDSGASTSFNVSKNDNGYVARWINIAPRADGAFRIRVNAGTVKSYPFGVFRLRRQAGPEES